MTNAIVVHQPTEIISSEGRTADRIALAIAAWLDAKGKRSGSERTPTIYGTTIANFRVALVGAGGDLDDNSNVVGLAAQGWAGRGNPAASTYNHRLAVLSSFYRYAVKFEILPTNPIDRVERRKVDEYAGAVAIEDVDLQAALIAIDTTKPEGVRDYALITLAVTTGRRLAEIAALTWGDVLVNGDAVTVITRRAKGGKSARDRVAKKVAAALLRWREVYMQLTGTMAADTPLWVSVKHHSGKALTVRAIEYIAERRLGSGHFHLLRHTFAKSLEAAGASASEVQARLLHSSLATTGRYLQRLRSDVNPYADKLADKLLG